MNACKNSYCCFCVDFPCFAFDSVPKFIVVISTFGCRSHKISVLSYVDEFVMYFYQG